MQTQICYALFEVGPDDFLALSYDADFSKVVTPLNHQLLSFSGSLSVVVEGGPRPLLVKWLLNLNPHEAVPQSSRPSGSGKFVFVC